VGKWVTVSVSHLIDKKRQPMNYAPTKLVAYRLRLRSGGLLKTYLSYVTKC
jgi:hypothetical protein